VSLTEDLYYTESMDFKGRIVTAAPNSDKIKGTHPNSVGVP